MARISILSNNDRALITNRYRPCAMIEFERHEGMDHGLTDNMRMVRSR